MGLDDFGLSVLASILANKLDFGAKPRDVPTAGLESDKEPAAETKEPVRKHAVKFKTFDAWNDLSKLLEVVKEPLISILIEDEPSTHYRLPGLVLESRITGEWFVFSRGRMSFEGDGGGLRNSQAILDQVKAAEAAVGVWILPQAQLDMLDNGYETWANVKLHAVPLLARVAHDYSWSEIERNVSKQLQR